MEREWKLGDDLIVSDNLLDGVTFGDLILTVQCNCRDITQEAVRKELRGILDSRRQDMDYLLEKNMAAIIKEAGKGRG